jgi:hypothetical protein
MFPARGVALNVTTGSVQLRVLHNRAYLSARLKLQGTNSNMNVALSTALFNLLRLDSFKKSALYLKMLHIQTHFRFNNFCDPN